MKMTGEKLSALRAQMKEQGLDGFIVPRADEYQGEFVAPYAERLKYLTGFTGSGGIAAVLKDKAVALTDGRYLIQIAQQVDAEHFETGNMIKDPLEKWLEDNAESEAVIGYDPWLHTPAQIKKFEDKGLNMQPVTQNPLDEIWTDQPGRPSGKVQVFPSSIAGVSLKAKKAMIAQNMADKNVQACIITLPDSIAWLLNVRGEDIAYIPGVLSYAVIYADISRPIQWMNNPDHMNEKLIEHFDGEVECGASEELQSALSFLKGRVLLDEKRSPIWFKHVLEGSGVEIVPGDDPCIDPKAVKTASEQEAIRKAHIIDGVALVKFLHWLEGNASGQSEVSVSEKLKVFRGNHRAYKGNSFPTIAGFGDNGAIIHYRASKETDKQVGAGSLLLLDSGGQYLDAKEGIAGTTDITRTVAIGKPSQEMREHFTLVLKGHIALANAKFPKGTTGAQIDTLARAPLWARGLDYAHGTGHGVGCYLAVHEEAASISPRGTQALIPGMLLSNEPGYYEEGAYGIRIENLVLVQEKRDFLGFETVSLAPIDRSLIIAEMLDRSDLDWLNAYHEKVYETLSPHLSGEVLEWLKKQTAVI